MLVVYAKIELERPIVAMPPWRPVMMDKALFCLSEASQSIFDAKGWWENGEAAIKHHDVLIAYFPDTKQQDALDFISWVHYKPGLMDVMTVLERDGILWKMWSVEMPYAYAGTTIADPSAWQRTISDLESSFKVRDAKFDSMLENVSRMSTILTPNEEDLKFLKSLRVKWDSDEETKA